MKIKITCDKRYGNNTKSMMDCNFFNSGTLEHIVNVFTMDGVLMITESVVDYYNDTNTTKCRKSFKTAENIAKQIKKLYKDK